jgi:hypothetical protein
LIKSGVEGLLQSVKNLKGTIVVAKSEGSLAKRQDDGDDTEEINRMINLGNIFIGAGLEPEDD